MESHRVGLRDPISTPARRRRLAAEITRKVVKDYYIRACKNVSTKRIQFSAARKIQMLVRRYRARRILQQLRHERQTNMIVTIQCSWRRYRATKLRLKLSFERKMKIATTFLAIPSQRLWRGRLARQKFHVLLEKHKLGILGRRLLSAVMLQRQTRGMLARQAFMVIIIEHRRIKLQQHIASIKVQSLWRKFLARKMVNRRRHRRAAALLILQRIRSHLHKLHFLSKRRQEKAGITLNLAFKCFLARRYRMKFAAVAKAEGEAAMLQLIAAQDHDDEANIDDNDNDIVQRSKVLDIATEVPRNIFDQLHEDGPIAALKWCVDAKLISYSLEHGFDLGYLLTRVITAADMLTSNRTTCADDIEDHVPMPENVMKISTEEIGYMDHYDTSSLIQDVASSMMPFEWNTAIDESICRNVSMTISLQQSCTSELHNLVNDDQPVELLVEASAIEILITTASTPDIVLTTTTLGSDLIADTDGDNKQAMNPLVVRILLKRGSDTTSSVSQQLRLILSDLIVEVGSTCYSPKKRRDINEPPTPASMHRSYSNYTVHSSHMDDNDLINSHDILDMDSPITSMRVVFEAPPVIEVPVIIQPPDYCAMAMRIQRRVRLCFEFYSTRARWIQQLIRRRNIRIRWRRAVYRVLIQAKIATVTLQCYYRRMIAKRIMGRMRAIACELLMKRIRQRADDVIGKRIAGLSTNTPLPPVIRSRGGRPLSATSPVQVRVVDNINANVIYEINLPAPPPGCIDILNSKIQQTIFLPSS